MDPSAPDSSYQGQPPYPPAQQGYPPQAGYPPTQAYPAPQQQQYPPQQPYPPNTQVQQPGGYGYAPLQQQYGTG